MPVGRGYPPSASGSSIVPGASAEGDIAANAAVALLTDGAGGTKLVECSAISHGDKFYGFAKKDALDGQNVEVKTMRGSIVTPLVEDGGSITAGQPVFLSRTPGKVSGSVPAEYDSGAYGIEYTGGSAADPSSFTNPSGNTSSVVGISGFGVPSGKSWVFRALYKSNVDGSIRFRLNSGNDARMWWDINARPANPDLDPNKSILEIAPNSGSNSATTVTSEEYTINEGVTIPFVVAGGAGSLTFEWSVNGGPWQSDGSSSWLQYMTETPVPKPVTVQVGYGVSDSSLTLITDLRIV